MIPPAFLLLRVGRIWLPLPLALLWPFYVVAFTVALVVLPLTPIRKTTLRQRMLMPLSVAGLIHALRGLEVDVTSGDGERVYCRIW